MYTFIQSQKLIIPRLLSVCLFIDSFIQTALYIELLKRNRLEDCEGKVELRADNQRFCSIKRMAGIECVKTALKALGG